MIRSTNTAPPMLIARSSWSPNLDTITPKVRQSARTGEQHDVDHCGIAEASEGKTIKLMSKSLYGGAHLLEHSLPRAAVGAVAADTDRESVPPPVQVRGRGGLCGVREREAVELAILAQVGRRGIALGGLALVCS